MAGYLEEGFLALQYAIDMSILELSSNRSFSASSVSLSMRRFPYPPYVDDNFVLVIQQQLPFIIMLSFVFSSMQIVRDLVHEKEQKLKVGIDVTTLNEDNRYQTNCIFYCDFKSQLWDNIYEYDYSLQYTLQLG